MIRRCPNAFSSHRSLITANEVSAMEDDLVAGLTRQVKQVVIENYLSERRLVELQIEELKERAAQTVKQARSVRLRLARLSSLMIRPRMQQRLLEILEVSNLPFWTRRLDENYVRSVRLISTRGITQRVKFRKMLLEAYVRFYHWMKRYRCLWEDLANECSAVNANIDAFQKNFDLLTMLSFMRSLDTRGIEIKKILGDNFTAAEISQLDKNLYIGPVSMEKLNVPAPLDLPDCGALRGKLSNLAEEVFQRYPAEVKKIMRLMNLGT